MRLPLLRINLTRTPLRSMPLTLARLKAITWSLTIPGSGRRRAGRVQSLRKRCSLMPSFGRYCRDVRVRLTQLAKRLLSMTSTAFLRVFSSTRREEAIIVRPIIPPFLRLAQRRRAKEVQSISYSEVHLQVAAGVNASLAQNRKSCSTQKQTEYKASKLGASFRD